ncbi:hypothetical protein TMatcc_003342 [Talaromyces marneffei ATCC 18224]|uniref:uncharacterized protein n=1 Tax=Talaromyces marneffei TaxID=37727 RepID=UPI0012AA59B9|nr:uncharacterized protein EYB26_001597 [Talaromyces marneffei]KAE8556037.1 hypothetical protein EYB25_000736 [Talaromyces marneffei]QGA13945.1 hypothetical protein EYB26_001597 [Talaromyces marneffei]
MVLGHNQYHRNLQEQHFLVEEQPQLPIEASQSAGNAPVVRRKFAKPPVKVACLACRASRTRCDGQEPCSSCANKGRACSYLPSKRGGPRKKKSSAPPSDPDELAQTSPWDPPIVQNSHYEEDGAFSQIEPLALPGAGLRHLDFNPEVQGMFVGMFAHPGEGHHPAVPVSQVSLAPGGKQPTVRAYGSEQDILNAYYEFIHPYFPILPPRIAQPSPDLPLEDAGSHPNSPSDEASLAYQPVSPLSCAISAILALVPLPNIPDSPNVMLRRSYSQTYARLATMRIEADGELIDSVTDPSQALNYARPTINRPPFHPQAPVELESILALLVLSIYEYAQRGNMMKMRYRAGQAWVLAMNLSLNALGPEQDEFTEAKRRAWWMTYFCVLQGSIVSVTPCPVMINDTRFTTPYPQFASDPEGWSILLQAQQVLIASNQFAVDLNRCLKSRSNMQWIYDQMKQLDAWTSSLMTQANAPSSVQRSGDMSIASEFDTAESIRAMSRIKLASSQIRMHQFRAFSDLPGFIKKHFDLAPHGSNVNDPFHIANNGDSNPLECQCHQFHPMGNVIPTEYNGPASDTSAAAASGPVHPHYCWLGPGFPFSAQQSSDICLRAALMISHMVGSLPYPVLLRPGDRRDSTRHPPFGDPALLDPRTQFPRTMPYYAACTMQGSYALLMLVYKTRVAISKDRTANVLYDEGHQSSADQMLDGLSNGLERIVGVISNFSRAFEALSGMRENIERAIHTAFSQP